MSDETRGGGTGRAVALLPAFVEGASRLAGALQTRAPQCVQVSLPVDDAGLIEVVITGQVCLTNELFRQMRTGFIWQHFGAVVVEGFVTNHNDNEITISPDPPERAGDGAYQAEAKPGGNRGWPPPEWSRGLSERNLRRVL